MRCPFAVWRGPVPNLNAGQMIAQPHGLIPHVIVGSLGSADMIFHQAAQQKSAHFGVGKDGRLVQWVDTDDKAWAEAAGNSLWWSAECEGLDTEPHTPAQIDTLALLLVWLHSLSPFALQVTDDPDGYGVTSHRCGGVAWGGHTCPGDQRHAQRGEIVLRAKGQLAPKEPDMAMIAAVPNLAADHLGRVQHWETDTVGNIKCWNGAPQLKSLGQLAATHPPIKAIEALPDGSGVILIADDGHQEPSGEWAESTYKITVSM